MYEAYPYVLPFIGRHRKDNLARINVGYYFIYSSFFKQIVKRITLFLIFVIDNEKGIPHFKFVLLDYIYSGVYLQKCKVTGNSTLLIALLFCLKVGMSKMTKLTLIDL